MEPIIVKNIIEENKVTISFDMKDGSLSFPSVELGTEGDIDLNTLVVKLSELIEHKRKLNVDYEDTGSLLDSNPKMSLVKNTLAEIYTKFNSQFDNPENGTIIVETNVDDDLPF
jgi:hypothetical protein